MYAKIFGACALISLLITCVTMWVAFILTKIYDDPFNDVQNTFLYNQVKLSGSLFPLPSDATPIKCFSNSVIGYIPALFYSNMFTIAFLELKSLTKISDDKSSKDFKSGLMVIVATSASYILMYLPLILSIVSIEKNKLPFITGVFNAFVRVHNPFSIDLDAKMNFFDLFYIFVFVSALA